MVSAREMVDVASFILAAAPFVQVPYPSVEELHS
jgi:hypothetical protein